MRIQSIFLPLAYAAIASSLASPAAARDATGLEGHWTGMLQSITDPTLAAAAELSLDNFGCYALSIKRDQGIEIGLYSVTEEGKLLLKKPDGSLRLVFEVNDGKNEIKVLPEKGAKLPEGCCTMTR